MEKDTVKKLAKKWYDKIGFPKEFDEGFDKLLSEENDLLCIKFEEYDISENKDCHGKNLIMFLYFCEELYEKYKALGIPDDIFYMTIGDFAVSVKRWFKMTGNIGLQSAEWMSNHFSMRLFKLGRLQFCMEGSYIDIPQKGIKKGDNMIDIHIPDTGESLAMSDCIRDFKRSEEFFANFFPDYKYQYYMCFSWLLDDVLKSFLKEGSNILQFQKLFEVVHAREQDSIIHFMFKYGFKNREEIRECPASSDFARKVKEYALSGGVFRNTLGIRDRNKAF